MNIQKAALEAVQHYLLILPEGAHKGLLYQIADALKDQSRMPTALYDAKYYLLKYAGDHIQNIADAGVEEIPALLRQIDNALKEEPSKYKYYGTEPIHIKMDIHCVYYRISDGFSTYPMVRDECPYKKDGIKPCIKRGKPCNNLQGELIEILKVRK